MEKDLKVESNMPLSSSSQEVTKDLLDMIGEYRGLVHPLSGRIGSSHGPLSQQASYKKKNPYFFSTGLLDLFCSQQRAFMELITWGSYTSVRSFHKCTVRVNPWRPGTAAPVGG